MKKTLLFAATIKLSLDHQTGIMKKVFAQAKVFESAFDVYMWGFGDNEILYAHNGEITVVDHFKSKTERRLKYFKALKSFAAEKQISVFYFRYASADLCLLNVLKCLKKRNVLSIIEIPSYPYKGEFQDTLKKRLIYMLDCMVRRKLKKYVSRVVIFVEKPKEIYGIPCINTMNGIDSDVISLVASIPSPQLNLIAVASMLSHHGFDRMIMGLRDYYANVKQTRQIVFHIVGDGPELDSYKTLCEKHHLGEHVIFYGQKTGKDLDEVFAKADIAVGSLGLHRIGLVEGSTLKNREYAVRGLPIVYATYELFLKDSIYALEIPADESPVNLTDVLAFWNRISQMEGLHAYIRNDAVSKCDMSVTMKPIVEYMESNIETRKINE